MTVLEKFSAFYTNLESMQPSELGSIYSSDVIFIDPVAKHVGLNAVERYFSKLLINTPHCEFVIHTTQLTNSGYCMVSWTMEYSSARMNKGNPISVDGISMLAIVDEKITYQRDYYDLGQMLYENVPVLGSIIRKIRRSMA